MEESIWKERIKKDTSVKGLGLCNRIKERVYAKEGKGIFTVQRRERGSANICGGSAKKRVYSIFQVVPNFTSTFCGKKE